MPLALHLCLAGGAEAETPAPLLRLVSSHPGHLHPWGHRPRPQGHVVMCPPESWGNQSQGEGFPPSPQSQGQHMGAPASAGRASKAQAAVSLGALLSTVMSPGPNPDWGSMGCDTGWPSWDTPSSESTPENHVAFRVGVPQGSGWRGSSASRLCRGSSGTGAPSLVSLKHDGPTPLVQVFHTLVPSLPGSL